MSIEIEVPLEAMARPGVAQALANLMVGLSGSASISVTADPGEAKPTAMVDIAKEVDVHAPDSAIQPAHSEAPAITVTAETEASTASFEVFAPAEEPPAASPAPSATSRSTAKAQTPPPAPKRAAATSPAKTKSPKTSGAKPLGRPPRARKPTPAGDLLALPPEERWERYVEELPTQSRKFVSMLKAKGKLTVAEAVEALHMASPKAMGGLTGAMARWAPKQGVTLPFEARQDQTGGRFWVWTGAVS